MSVHFDVLAAVKALLDPLAGLPEAQVRAYPLVLGSEPPPLLFVCDPGQPKKAKELFGRWQIRDYEALVLLLLAGNRQGGSQKTQDRSALRSRILDALDADELAGVASLIDVDVDPPGAGETQAALGGNWDVSGWLARYRRAEQRAG